MKFNEDIIKFLDSCGCRLEMVSLWDNDDHTFLYSKKSNKVILEIKQWEFEYYEFENTIRGFIRFIKKKSGVYRLENGMSEDFIKVKTRRYKILLSIMGAELENLNTEPEKSIS